MIQVIKSIGKLLKSYRKKSNLSQLEVAEKMGLSVKSGRKYISRLENGTIERSYFDTILNYLDAVGVSWITFFTESFKINELRKYIQQRISIAIYSLTFSILPA